VEQTDGKTKQDRVTMAIVGSYPKPGDMLRGSARELYAQVLALDPPLYNFHPKWEWPEIEGLWRG
jgi:hypothetical protein